MSLRLVLAAAVLLLVPVAGSRADTFVITPDVTSDQGLQGSFVVDTVTGTFTSSAVVDFPQFVGTTSFGGDYFIGLESPDNQSLHQNVTIDLIQTASLQGYRGGRFQALIRINGFGTFPVTGVITDVSPPSSVTPEAPSLLLLGTGLLGAIGVARRRLFAGPGYTRHSASG